MIDYDKQALSELGQVVVDWVPSSCTGPEPFTIAEVLEDIDKAHPGLLLPAVRRIAEERGQVAE